MGAEAETGWRRWSYQRPTTPDHVCTVAALFAYGVSRANTKKVLRRVEETMREARPGLKLMRAVHVFRRAPFSVLLTSQFFPSWMRKRQGVSRCGKVRTALRFMLQWKGGLAPHLSTVARSAKSLLVASLFASSEGARLLPKHRLAIIFAMQSERIGSPIYLYTVIHRTLI